MRRTVLLASLLIIAALPAVTRADTSCGHVVWDRKQAFDIIEEGLGCHPAREFALNFLRDGQSRTDHHLRCTDLAGTHNRVRCTLRAKDDSIIGHFTFEIRFLKHGTFN